jgi:hypothetical protein
MSAEILENLIEDELAPGFVSRAAAGRAKKIGGRGRPSITKTERLRSANLLRMPKGLMCKLR